MKGFCPLVKTVAAQNPTKMKEMTDLMFGEFAKFAALIASADRYVLATFFQGNLKYVRPGQFAELSFNLYPGQIFKGHVDTIWKANGVGEYLPSDEIPKFELPSLNIPQGQYAAKIIVDEADPSRFPLGAQGAAAQDFHPHDDVAELALSALMEGPLRVDLTRSPRRRGMTAIVHSGRLGWRLRMIAILPARCSAGALINTRSGR